MSIYAWIYEKKVEKDNIVMRNLIYQINLPIPTEVIVTAIIIIFIIILLKFSKKKPNSATEEWVEKGGDMREMLQELAEESGLEDITEEEKKEIINKDFGKLTKKQINDRQVYASIRAYGELSKIDGEFAPSELQLMAHFSEEEKNKLSGEYNQESDEFKYVWAKEENVFECLKTYNKSQVLKFFENLFSIAASDGEIKSEELSFLIKFYMEITGTGEEKAKKKVVEMFKAWKEKAINEK